MTPSLLRPEFTRMLASRLAVGECINLTAPHGFGRRRTVEDLRIILSPEIRVLYADMKFRKDDFAATLDDLCSQAELAQVRDFPELVRMLAADSHASLLILHNIDLLRTDTHDPLFDSDLLAHLSAFSGHAHLALLSISEAVYTDWPLPCRPLPMPPLAPGSGTA